MRYCTDPKIDATIKRLVKQGWKVVGKGQHGKLEAPNGKHLGYPYSPSDSRTHLNWHTRLRRIESDAPIQRGMRDIRVCSTLQP